MSWVFFRFFAADFTQFSRPCPHKCGLAMWFGFSSSDKHIFRLLENFFQGEGFSENTALQIVLHRKLSPKATADERQTEAKRWAGRFTRVQINQRLPSHGIVHERSQITLPCIPFTLISSSILRTCLTSSDSHDAVGGGGRLFYNAVDVGCSPISPRTCGQGIRLCTTLSRMHVS